MTSPSGASSEKRDIEMGSGQARHVPVITLRDLEDFHARHFGAVAFPGPRAPLVLNLEDDEANRLPSNPHPIASFAPPSLHASILKAFHSGLASHSALPTDSKTFMEEDDDDGLGYYHDGVKRTLTDEQIAIFRHSEIESILRENRRDDAEATEKDPSQDTEPELPKRKKQKSSKQKAPRSRMTKHDFQNSDGITHRRAARELDNIVWDKVELDY